MKDRAVAVIVRDERLLVIHRRKHGTAYVTLPGGGVEPGETPEAACVRELQEETGLHGTVGEHLLTLSNAGRVEHYFRVDAPAGEPVLGGEEAEADSPTNRYEPAWLPLGDLSAADLKPLEIKRLLSRAC
ncbi:NUDIX domain-containing protein [Kribbella sp. NPDC003505]|uniref:NUDIX domain-containing protein n=1 Tax=Kribbella sp. NPDC003505 TaxID=3154448 RepID=UPI00339E8D62